MLFFKKLKEVVISVLPIVAIILLLHFSICPFETDLLIKFFVAIVLISVGEVFFLTGVDSTIMPMGEMVGNSVNKVSNFFLFVLFAFLFGMFATIAEPDVQVFASEIVLFGAINLSKTALLFIIGAGVGLFLAFALIRIVKHIPVKVVFLSCLVILFILSSLLPESFIAIAFDAGGSTVGIVTTPFLLSLSAGIVEKTSKNSGDTFGAVGLAALGPILALLFMCLLVSGDGAANVVQSASYNIFVDILLDTIMAIVPLVAVFYLFQIIYIKLPKNKKKSLFVGVLITFVGLYLFLFGINYGLLEMGNKIGSALKSQNIYIIMIVFVVFGFSIVFTEPAVRVLGAQIEAETQGNINRRVVTVSIAIAMALAVCLSALRIYFNISIWYFIGIGYAVIALLTIVCPSMFVSIAFDSGGVTGGPISAALLLPAMVALSDSPAEGFGFLAIMSMMAVFVLQIIGVIYQIKIYGIKKNKYKVALRIAYGADRYSNMEQLEARHKKLMEAKNEKK